jgi:TRAP-type C4-dicarboxylate transport system substrate-binding protein
VDKAGGEKQIVLRLALTAGNLSYSHALRYFLQRVNELSNGELRVKVAYRWGNFAANAEQQAVRAVRNGRADLTYVGTRTFDSLGVNSFRALDAPMLVDGYALQDAVITGDVASKMLGDLHSFGMAGLGIFAGDLDRPAAVKRPLLSPSDWRGITLFTYLSPVAGQAIRALGAKPTFAQAALQQGLLNGTIQGFAKGLVAIQVNSSEHLAPYVTANVNLWPNTAVLVANSSHLAGLSDEQQGWLRQAAAEAAARSTSFVNNDQQIAADVCQGGGRFANASKPDLAALRHAFAPVYKALERDPQTKRFIERIQALKAAISPDRPLAIPTRCTGRAPAAASNDPLAGSWTTAKIDESQFVRAFIATGGSETKAHSVFSELGNGSNRFAVLGMKFHDGEFDAYQSGDGRPGMLSDNRRYSLGNKHTVSLQDGRPDCVGGVTYRYELKGDTLRFHVVRECTGGDAPVNATLYASFPYKRSG